MIANYCSDPAAHLPLTAVPTLEMAQFGCRASPRIQGALHPHKPLPKPSLGHGQAGHPGLEEADLGRRRALGQGMCCVCSPDCSQLPRSRHVSLHSALW